jgi:hypothetical protein
MTNSVAQVLEPVGPLPADLERVLAMSIGHEQHISRIECRPSIHQSSFPVHDVDVTFEDGRIIRLVAKAAHHEAMSPEARRAKPPFLWNDARERVTYDSLLAGLDLNTPRFFGSYVDGQGTQYLLLERIDGIPLWQCSEFEAWREAARWLARFHNRIGLHAAVTAGAAAHLIRYDRPYYDRWMRRARAFQETDTRDVAALGERHATVVDWLVAERTAFIHGEFYAANILVDRTGGRALVRPLDWEMAALGPALVDLACLIAGGWTDDERTDIADVYFLESARAGGHIPPRTHYLKTLDCCLIHLCVRNLGWSRDWTPPPDRSHDWLREALRLCDKWQI